MQYLLIIFIIVTMFSACQNKEKAISTYKDRGIPITLVNLNIATDTLPLKLTDIGKDLEVVRLETTDSSLFGNASYLIGTLPFRDVGRENTFLLPVKHGHLTKTEFLPSILGGILYIAGAFPTDNTPKSP